MSHRIKELISKGHSEIANGLYSFLKKHDYLPEEHYVEHIVDEFKDLNEMGNVLNGLFLGHTKRALIGHAPAMTFNKFSKEFDVKHIENKSDSTEDGFEIRFLDRILDYADDAVLEDLHLSIQHYQRKYLDNELFSLTTLGFRAPPKLIESLLAIDGVNTYLYQSAVIPTDGRSYETHILHIGAIERLYYAKKIADEAMLAVWELLRPYWKFFDTSNKPSYPELIAINVGAN